MREAGFHLVLHIGQILDPQTLFPAQNEGRVGILHTEALVDIEDKDILELQPLGMVNGHEVDCIFGGGYFHFHQVLVTFQDLVNHADKTGQALEACFFKTVGTKGQGIEVGLPTLGMGKGSYIIIIESVIVDFPNQIIEAMLFRKLSPISQYL